MWSHPKVTLLCSTTKNEKIVKIILSNANFNNLKLKLIKSSSYYKQENNHSDVNKLPNALKGIKIQTKLSVSVCGDKKLIRYIY